MVRLITDLTEEISAAQISYWKKDEMRNALKALKKKIDDKDRERKAAVINEVVDLAKSILTENPNLPFFVHEFNGKFVLYSSLSQYTNFITIGHPAPLNLESGDTVKISSNKSTNSPWHSYMVSLRDIHSLYFTVIFFCR